MKRLFSVLLIVALTAGLAVPALAADNWWNEGDPAVIYVACGSTDWSLNFNNITASQEVDLDVDGTYMFTVTRQSWGSGTVGFNTDEDLRPELVVLATQAQLGNAEVLFGSMLVDGVLRAEINQKLNDARDDYYNNDVGASEEAPGCVSNYRLTVDEIESLGTIGPGAIVTISVIVKRAEGGDDPTELDSAAVTVTAPKVNATPVTTATTTETGYTCGAVTWTPEVTNKFLGRTAYTASVTLTADTDYTFADDFTATINGQTATVTGNDGDTVTISCTFPVTAPTDTGVAVTVDVKTSPDIQVTITIYLNGNEIYKGVFPKG